ncbi:hypothetical protein R6242_10775 [Iodobacter sp. CM08]|uniref:hypothetical protein n=1 Tax=Iodobacter sp. CM08 TaxID=3085902 RepID=UPI002982934B|nr:hypothetical protein [Iodobacter sp. CM08]MDW5417048.1 hypothetical protein [Iodobacter sp. CM08]
MSWFNMFGGGDKSSNSTTNQTYNTTNNTQNTSTSTSNSTNNVKDYSQHDSSYNSHNLTNNDNRVFNTTDNGAVKAALDMAEKANVGAYDYGVKISTNAMDAIGQSAHLSQQISEKAMTQNSDLANMLAKRAIDNSKDFADSFAKAETDFGHILADKLSIAADKTAENARIANGQVADAWNNAKTGNGLGDFKYVLYVLGAISAIAVFKKG